MRRRADSPLGPVTQEPHPPAKRLRSASRSQSPDSASRHMMRNDNGNSSGQASATSPRVIRAASPSRPTLPPLHPLPQLQPGQASAPPTANADRGYQSFSAVGNAAAQSQSREPPAPGTWAPNWPPGHMARHSMDASHTRRKSASTSPERSGRIGGDRDRPSELSSSTTTSGPDIVFTRDVTNRQPRSMMACVRCRRQKMKCDGPSGAPCRGCRQAQVPCKFETRNRPKSISSLPSRGSPFVHGALPPGRGGTPGAGGLSFYPSTAQAAPPITSRPALMSDYAPPRGVREPMPPPPGGSISAIAGAPYPPPLGTHSPPLQNPPGNAPPYYGPPPPGGPYSAGPRTSIGPHSATPSMDSHIDGRLRSLETAFRSVATLPAAVAGIQNTLGSILRAQQEVLAHGGGGGGGAVPAPMGITAPPRMGGNDIPEQIWESYRAGAWPLTPWLPGISPFAGLPGLVLGCLGRRADRNEASRREGDMAAEAVLTEVSRLLASQIPWTRDEVLALGVFATWTSDPALGCLATGMARDLHLDRPSNLRRSHEEWREWIYVVLADHMLHLPDFSAPVVYEPVAQRWRELVSSVPQSQADPGTHDRDIKLLAWLELSEILIEIHNMQCSFRPLGDSPMSPVGRRESDPERRDHSRPGSGPSSGDPITDRDRALARDIWRRFQTRLESWAVGCGARHDPVLALHFNYALLYAASPVFTANERVWMSLTTTQEGCAQLERGRDAAFTVLQSLGSPDIARTLQYAFPVLRPFFGLAIAHLVAMTAMVHNPQIIALGHVQDMLRGTAHKLAAAAPFESAPRHTGPRSLNSPPLARPGSDGPRPGTSRAPLPQSLLFEMAETGAVIEIGKREIVGFEPNRELWSRLLG